MELIKPTIQKWEKLCRSSKFLFYLYARPYRKTIAREIALGEITDSDRVLNIGCGALPFTAFYLQKLSGAAVTAIDVDSRAVEQAFSCFSRLDSVGQVEFKVMDGKTAVKYQDFDVVLAALQTDNKLEILQQLHKYKSSGGWKFIVREPRSSFKGQYDYLPADLEPADAVRQYFPTFDRSLLLTPDQKITRQVS